MSVSFLLLFVFSGVVMALVGLSGGGLFSKFGRGVTSWGWLLWVFAGASEESSSVELPFL